MTSSYKIIESKTHKRLASKDVNYVFDKTNGTMHTWGETFEDDPDWCEHGPTIADIEITTKCDGPGGKLCKFCYKGNKPQGDNMSFETFKVIFDKYPRTLTQIAFGADANLTANPELWDMMKYCRDNGRNEVVPNITLADASDEVADKLAEHCGAVAVSRYTDFNLCYDTIQRLVERGMDQVNIHMMICEETYDHAMQCIEDYQTDPRLEGMNAIVFLSLKQKNRGSKFTPLAQAKYFVLVHTALDAGIKFGFDSCGANKFLLAMKDHPNYDNFYQATEPCESTCFSSYVDVKGAYYPCSFTPGTPGWDEGIDLTSPDVSFIEGVWKDSKTNDFRDSLLTNLDENNVRACPLYNI